MDIVDGYMLTAAISGWAVAMIMAWVGWYKLHRASKEYKEVMDTYNRELRRLGGKLARAERDVKIWREAAVGKAVDDIMDGGQDD